MIFTSKATNMPFAFVAAAVCAFVGAVISWNVATVAVFRILGINLSCSLPFHFFRRKAPEVLNALRGRTINTYVFVSGLLLFACPLLAGASAYDYVVHRYIRHSPYGLEYVLTSLGWVILLVILGVRVSIGQWQKGAETGAGVAMLAILVLKVVTELAGVLTVVELLVPAAACCSFVHFGVRRIRGTLIGKRYASRRDMGVQRNFVSEKFVPSANPTAEKVARVQKSMASAMNVDLPSNGQRDD
jgi:hypothetical protein